MLADANADPLSLISVHCYGEDWRRIPAAMALSRRLGKPLFIGEFGVPGQTPQTEVECRRLLESILESGAPLAALWAFDLPGQTDFNVTAANDRAWQLDLITEANRRLREDQAPPAPPN